MVDGLSCAAFSRLQGADWAASVSILFAIAFDVLYEAETADYLGFLMFTCKDF